MTEGDAAGGQIQGKRKRQEDSWRLVRLADTELLALVADGLGGHPAGDVASREGADRFCEHFAAQRRGGESREPRDWLGSAMKETDAALQAMQLEDAGLYGMATTLVAVYRRGGEFWAASVGDSYLLLLRKGQLLVLNELHSDRGGVTSCVGFNLTRIDLADRLRVEPGDRFLLASDGIAALHPQEISTLLGNAPDAPAAVAALLGAIVQAGLPTQDNATTVAMFT